MDAAGKLRRVLSMGVRDYLRLATHPRLSLVKLTTRRDMSIEQTLRFLNLDGLTDARIDQLLDEHRRDHDFHSTLNDRFGKVRGKPCAVSPWGEMLYVYVRHARPQVIVMTGVFDGVTDAAILQAMARNDHGKLISIDLPAVELIAYSTDAMIDAILPRGHQPGWVIPDNLRGRYDLRLGDSRALLPAVWKEHPLVDVFIHDSLHTYDHQLFEYREAWPHVRDGGLLLSDDVLMNMAFWDFIRKLDRPYVLLGGFGVVRK